MLVVQWLGARGKPGTFQSYCNQWGSGTRLGGGEKSPPRTGGACEGLEKWEIHAGPWGGSDREVDQLATVEVGIG